MVILSLVETGAEGQWGSYGALRSTNCSSSIGYLFHTLTQTAEHTPSAFVPR